MKDSFHEPPEILNEKLETEIKKEKACIACHKDNEALSEFRTLFTVNTLFFVLLAAILLFIT
jgi:hypothetical protein